MKAQLIHLIVLFYSFYGFGQTCANGSAALSVTLDVTSFKSDGSLGDPDKSTTSIDFGTGTTYNVVAYEANSLEAGPVSPSWCSEAAMDFNGSLNFNPHIAEFIPGPCNVTNIPFTNLTSSSFPTNADGTVDVEFYETFNDPSVNPDQTWISGTVTLYACPAGIKLPVTLESFDGQSLWKYNQLQWMVASEEAFSHYEIEQSIDGQHWDIIGKVQKSNTIEALKKYKFNDLHPLSKTYYRLNMIDLDGGNEYSKIIVVDNHSILKDCALYPNPTYDVVHIMTKDLVKSIRMYDNFGKLLIEKSESDQIQMSTLQSGVYILQIITENGSVFTKKVEKL